MAGRIVVQPGDRFGRWTVAQALGVVRGHSRVLVQCDCGSAPRARSVSAIRSGKSSGCGCHRGKYRIIPAVPGEMFARLTLVREADDVPSGVRRRVVCACSCGSGEREYVYAEVRAGQVRSCGCLRAEMTVERNSSHGLAGTPLYKVWCSMHNRCAHDPRYAGRGIVVCDEWQEPVPFCRWAEANGYRHGLQIDRTDNNHGYGPDNCRWVSSSMNNRNKRSSVRWFVGGVEYETVQDVINATDMSRGSVQRYCHGNRTHPAHGPCRAEKLYPNHQ